MKPIAQSAATFADRVMASAAMPESGMGKVARIAVLNSHPIQYFAPLYAYLNAAPDLEVTALYLSDASIRGSKDSEFDRELKWDIDLLAGYRAIFLGDRAHRAPTAWLLVAGFAEGLERAAVGPL